MDVPIFGETGYRNANADALTFRDENGPTCAGRHRESYRTRRSSGRRASASTSTSARTALRSCAAARAFSLGSRVVRVDLESDRQHRRADGLYRELSAPPTAPPFILHPNAEELTMISGLAAFRGELGFIDDILPRSLTPAALNVAVDQRSPRGFAGTAEFLYSRDVTARITSTPTCPRRRRAFTGADTRPRWTTTASTTDRQRDVECHRHGEPERRPSWNTWSRRTRT